MSRRRKREDLDVVARRRLAESNVRRAQESSDPALCAARNGMYSRRGECFTCRLVKRVGDHCHLLEMCDRCGGQEDPCGTTQQLRERA